MLDIYQELKYLLFYNQYAHMTDELISTLKIMACLPTLPPSNENSESELNPMP